MQRASLKPDYVTVHFEYRRIVGPRSIHGGVTLAFSPAEAFIFESAAVWAADNYEAVVRRGVEEVLVRRVGSLPPLRVTLKAITWDEVNSCAVGFQNAARIAADAAWEV